MVQFTCSKCKVTSLLWFAHFGMRIGEGGRVLSCSHLVDHTSIPLIIQVNLIDKTRQFLVHHFLQLLYSKTPKGQFMIIYSVEIAHLPCFKILWITPILTSKLVHENPTLSEIYLKQPLHRLGKLRVNCTPLFEWCVVVYECKDKNHIKDTCVKEIGLHLHTLLMILHSLGNKIGRNPENYKWAKGSMIFDIIFLLMFHHTSIVSRT